MQQRILTPTFLLLSLATFTFFVSQSALFPVMPRHLTDLGAGPATVGLVMGILLVPAIVLRPLVGRMIDTRGRKLFLIGGLLVSGLANVGYAFAPSIAVIFIVRLFHGTAMASFYPSAAAITGDISPAHRRAEGFSYFSMFLFAGMALGPVIGEWLFLGRGHRSAFLAGAVFAGFGMVLASRLHRPIPEAGTPAPKHLIHRTALFPAGVLALVALTSGGLHAFIPVFVEETTKGNSGIFFALYAVVIIVMRTFVGKIADRHGRGVIVVPGTALCGFSSLVVVTGAGQTQLIVAAVLFGLGWGAMFPGLIAMIMDRIPTWERGSATGTFTSAFDLAFGGGQIVLGWVLAATNFETIFVIGGLSAFASGLLFTAARARYDARFPEMESSTR